MTFRLGAGAVIPGFEQGIVGMKVGGKRRITIPSSLAYGSQGSRPDPAEHHPALRRRPRLHRGQVTARFVLRAAPLLAAASLQALRGCCPAAPPRARVAFWPDEVPRAIAAEVDGVAVLETVKALGRFHRVHGSPGFAAAAEAMRARAEAAGLAEARIERLPADGQTRYAHFRSYLGWTAEEAVLEEVRTRRRASWPGSPTCRWRSPTTARTPTSPPSSWTWAPARGPRTTRARRSRAASSWPAAPCPSSIASPASSGAPLGFLSDFPNQTTAWSGDDRDLVRWGHLSPYETKNRFAFMLSKRQSEALRARLGAGERIVVHARVRARMVPATYDVVSAVLPGTDPAAGEVVLTAHLCHQSAGANDNASGSAAILEVGRALQAAVARGTLPRPRRSIRFLWLPEIAGAQAWLDPEPRDRAALGGRHPHGHGGRPAGHDPRHLPPVAHGRDPAPRGERDRAGLLRRRGGGVSSRYAERGGDPREGLAWLPGSREVFLGDVRPLELGSDHEVFEEASFGVPMVYFHDWPDVTIHTNKDLPENLDATKLGRVSYLGAGIAWTLAALPEAEAGRLLSVARAAVDARVRAAALRAELLDDPADAPRRPSRGGGFGSSAASSRWARSGPAWLLAVRSAQAKLGATRIRAKARSPPPRPRPGRRPPPVRPPARAFPCATPTCGALSTSTTTTISRRCSGPAMRRAALSGRQGGVLAYECLNLVDGRRTVSEIRDVLTGLYTSVPLSEVSEYLDRLARAKVVSWK